LRILKDFIHGFDFVRMAPDNAILRGGIPDKATARALVEPGKAVAIYVKGGTRAALAVDLPAGTWHAEWTDTRTGAVARAGSLDHPGGTAALESPPYTEDIALRIRRTDAEK
jgi:hypothetical protein